MTFYWRGYLNRRVFTAILAAFTLFGWLFLGYFYATGAGREHFLWLLPAAETPVANRQREAYPAVWHTLRREADALVLEVRPSTKRATLLQGLEFMFEEKTTVDPFTVLYEGQTLCRQEERTIASRLHIACRGAVFPGAASVYTPGHHRVFITPPDAFDFAALKAFEADVREAETLRRVLAEGVLVDTRRFYK